MHDPTASWATKAYMDDWVEGGDNMNEEWFGITAKGPRDASGLYKVAPRSAYYLLRDAFTLDPYAADTDLARIRAHFGRLRPSDHSATYEAARTPRTRRQQEARGRRWSACRVR